MTNKEAVETIHMAIAEIEWEYPMGYTVAFGKAIEALLQPEIVFCKDCRYNGTSLCQVQDSLYSLKDYDYCSYGAKKNEEINKEEINKEEK
jgi:hypothetical protein